LALVTGGDGYSPIGNGKKPMLLPSQLGRWTND
jgi:hypothetical protein